MTEKKQPEALRRASLLKLSGVLPGSVAMEVADDAIRLHAELETLRTGYAAARLEIESLRAAQPAGAQQTGAAYAALSDAEIDRIVPALEPVSEDFPVEWALWKDRGRIRNELRASHGQAHPTVDDLCARIKAADDAAADRDYMLDSNDCIAVLRGEWKAPLAMDKPERASHGQAPAQAAPAAVAGPEKGAAGNAYQTALSIRTAQGWNLGGDKVPVLYTDEINGQQVCRDDVWLCTTAALAAVPTTQPAPQQEAQEPVAWYVTGCGRLLDEYEAEAEARRIGGTAKAMPLYTAPQPSPASQGYALDAEQHEIDARHAAIYRWMLSHVADVLSIFDNWFADEEADTDELHDALAARARLEGKP